MGVAERMRVPLPAAMITTFSAMGTLRFKSPPGVAGVGLNDQRRVVAETAPRASGRSKDLKAQAHGLFQDAELEPMVDLSALEEVFVVLGPSGLTPDGTDIQRPEKPAPPSGAPSNGVRP